MRKYPDPRALIQPGEILFIDSRELDRKAGEHGKESEHNGRLSVARLDNEIGDCR
jgi:hypothetical protein